MVSPDKIQHVMSKSVCQTNAESKKTFPAKR